MKLRMQAVLLAALLAAFVRPLPAAALVAAGTTVSPAAADMLAAADTLSVVDTLAAAGALAAPAGSAAPAVTVPAPRVIDELSFVGVPLFVAGILSKGSKEGFRQNYEDPRENTRLVSSFNNHADDYLQYFGPAMTVGLKLGGVKGRSDWPRLLASSAMAYGAMALLVNSLKYTAREQRPDGSSRNSWPSGHTATSFVGATILHKEYGLTRSPWYSVAGYGVATSTAIMRVLNNRHWVSDIFSGAGIGIMSGELAYVLSDVIFRERHLLSPERPGANDLVRHPSFFGLSMGIGFGSRNMLFQPASLTASAGTQDIHIEFDNSTVVDVEGAYFLNRYIGIGGRLRVATTPVKGGSGLYNVETSRDDDLLKLQQLTGGAVLPAADQLVRQREFNVVSSHLSEFSAAAGLYFSLPLTPRLALGSKLLLGRTMTQELEVDAHYSGQVMEATYDMTVSNGQIASLSIGSLQSDGQTYDMEWPLVTIGGNNTTTTGTGLSLSYAYKQSYVLRAFIDYDYSYKRFTLTHDPYRFIAQGAPSVVGIGRLLGYDTSAAIYHVRKHQHTVVFGGSFCVSF